MGVGQSIRARIYDTAIIQMTVPWYAVVLQRIAPGSLILDVGVGTGRALLANAEMVTGKDLRIVGLDIDADYIRACREAVEEASLSDRVEVHLQSVYDHQGAAKGASYDAVYFSASFMLLPDPVGALKHVAPLLRPEGRIYFTQTFEHSRSRFVERAKPLLRWLTTVDFGQVSYEADFEQILDSAGVVIRDKQVLTPGKKRSGVLVVASIEG